MHVSAWRRQTFGDFTSAFRFQGGPATPWLDHTGGAMEHRRPKDSRLWRGARGRLKLVMSAAGVVVAWCLIEAAPRGLEGAMNRVSGPYRDLSLDGMIVYVAEVEHDSRPRHVAIVTSDHAAWITAEQRAGMFDALLAYESSLDDDDHRVWLLVEVSAPGAEAKSLESAWLDLPELGTPQDTAAAVLDGIGGPVDLVAESQGILIGEWTAFLLAGDFHGERRMLCLVTQSEPRPPCVDGLMARWYFRRALRQGTAGFANGPSVPLWIHRTDSHGLEAMSAAVLPLAAYVPAAQTPDAIAAEIMSDSLVTVPASDGVLRIDAASPGGVHRVAGNRRGSTVETAGVLEAGADPETFFRDQRSAKATAEMYFAEVVAYMQIGRPRLAFRAYDLHLRFAQFKRTKSVRETVDLGFEVLRLLDDAGEDDYVEWIGAAIADLAYRHGLDDQGATALRHAGIACAALGWSDRCITHFQRALTTGKLRSHLRSRIRMSYGISLLEFCGHEVDAPLDDRDHGYVKEATDQLRLAVEGYRRIRGKRAEWALHSIALELARAADLRGEHDAAVAQLTRLTERPVIAGDLALFSTAVVYLLLARRSLAASGGAARLAYLRDCLGLAEGGTTFPSLRVTGLYHLLLADALSETGHPGEALGLYGFAHYFQTVGFDALSNALGPDRPLDGWLAIDTIDRILGVASRAGPSVARAALCLADNAKSRFFRRDLGLQLEGLRAPYLGVALVLDREIRRQLLVREVDQRLILAEQEWYVEQQFAAREPAAPPLSATGYLVQALHGAADGDGPATGGELTPATLADLWRRLPEDSALVSLYAGRTRTTVAVQAGPDAAPVFHELPIEASALQRVATGLQEHFSGTGLYPKINAKRPGRYDATFWQPFAELSALLAPVADALTDRHLAVVCAHGVWHHLPLHALLLPALWQRGIPGPGLCYAPSFGLQRLLLARGDTQPWGAFTDMAVTSAPSRTDDDAQFRAAHDRICASLSAATPRLRTAFGTDATKERFHERSAARLHHVLAHGIHRGGADVMRSCLLLSDGNQLPDRAGGDDYGLAGLHLLLHGAIAEHLTVQACSLGRTLVAKGDELWGFSRAVLGSGARSVLSPLWDINLESSTVLLETFYRHWLHENMGRHRAWSAAQFAMYQGDHGPAWAHPYHWAAFTMVGV
jgi:hypothetical protein